MLDLLKAQVLEIMAVSDAIENSKNTKLIFQKLPIHMRRRAMSHDPKRMPKRLREAHTRQMKKSGPPSKSKRPSRKYRRRPSILLNEYNRRQGHKTWLQTHIWHAKRFHMIEKWGYKLAHYNNSGGYKANYKAVKEGCMIQDISFYNCVELIGPSDKLVEILKTHCKDGLTFGAKYYLEGDRQGSVTFYKKNGDPIGVVNFIYRPNATQRRTIWIWIHPNLYNDVISELMISFEIAQSSDDSKDQLYYSNTEYEMRILTHSLNRFRLCGHMSSRVLTDTLHQPDFTKIKNEDNMETDKEQSWYDKWCKDSTNLKSFIMQFNTFNNIESLNSPSQLPRHCVIGLTVLDPRYFFSSKKIKLISRFTDSLKIDTLDPIVSCSPLWESSVRNEVERNCKSNKQINDERSGNLVPGVDNDSEYNEEIISKIPIILIQNPGTDVSEKGPGFTSGLDIILPAKWGLPFWLSFMNRCPRPGGLNESHLIFNENLLINSPEINHPDTLAYVREAKEKQNELVDKYFRYPPNRRVNFIKNSISSPFYCEWKILMKEWTNENIVRVLRNRDTISLLTTPFDRCNAHKRKSCEYFPKKPQSLPIDNEAALKIRSLLVTVKITILEKGNPKDFALICLPTAEDYMKCYWKNKWIGPIQNCKHDIFESKRKALKENHQCVLKCARRHRKKARKSCNQEELSCYNMATTITERANEMKDLWLPECTTVRNSCDRETIGYVVQGGFSCSEAKGIGWGYVVGASLLSMIEKEINIVLIRNTESLQYRWARLQILPLE